MQMPTLATRTRTSFAGMDLMSSACLPVVAPSNQGALAVRTMSPVVPLMRVAGALLLKERAVEAAQAARAARTEAERRTRETVLDDDVVFKHE